MRIRAYSAGLISTESFQNTHTLAGTILDFSDNDFVSTESLEIMDLSNKIQQAIELYQSVSTEGVMSKARVIHNQRVMQEINDILGYDTPVFQISSEQYDSDPGFAVQISRESEEGIFTKMWNAIKEFFSKIYDWLFGGDDEEKEVKKEEKTKEKIEELKPTPDFSAALSQIHPNAKISLKNVGKAVPSMTQVYSNDGNADQLIDFLFMYNNKISAMYSLMNDFGTFLKESLVDQKYKKHEKSMSKVLDIKNKFDFAKKINSPITSKYPNLMYIALPRLTDGKITIILDENEKPTKKVLNLADVGINNQGQKVPVYFTTKIANKVFKDIGQLEQNNANINDNKHRAKSSMDEINKIFKSEKSAMNYMLSTLKERGQPVDPNGSKKLIQSQMALFGMISANYAEIISEFSHYHDYTIKIFDAMKQGILAYDPQKPQPGSNPKNNGQNNAGDNQTTPNNSNKQKPANKQKAANSTAENETAAPKTAKQKAPNPGEGNANQGTPTPNKSKKKTK